MVNLDQEFFPHVVVKFILIFVQFTSMYSSIPSLYWYSYKLVQGLRVTYTIVPFSQIMSKPFTPCMQYFIITNKLLMVSVTVVRHSNQNIIMTMMVDVIEKKMMAS